MTHRIAVTGGAGFIGTHLTRSLLERGHDVTVLDNLSMGKRENVASGSRFCEADIADEDRVLEIFRQNRIERVCHLAARVSIRASVDGFVDDARTNIMGTLSVLKAILQTDVANVVFASSMAVYSDSVEAKPIAECYSTRPISPYGISKLAGGNFVGNIAELAGRQWSVLRLFNTYGPGQTYTPYVGVITIFATKLLRGESPVIFGDGEQRRDFVYVGDVVQGFTKAIERDGSASIYNIGSGRPRTVNEVARLLQVAISPETPLTWAASQPGEIRNSVADISHARNTLGYHPSGSLEAELGNLVNSLRARVEKSSAKAVTA